MRLPGAPEQDDQQTSSQDERPAEKQQAPVGFYETKVKPLLRSKLFWAIVAVALVVIIVLSTALPLTLDNGSSSNNSSGSSGGGNHDEGSQPGRGTNSSSSSQRPNIVFVLTDDQDSQMNSLDYMPQVQQHLMSQGTTFQHHFCTVAICCPARAVIWTGMNAHNTNVTALGGAYGGYDKFVQGGFNDANLPVYLQEGGYQTYYVGKLMNSFGEGNHNKPCPKGWTGSEFLVDPYTYSYYNPGTSRNCAPVKVHNDTYSTDMLGRMAFDFLDDAKGSDDPFFLTIATIAPHSQIQDGKGGPPVPAEKYRDYFPDAQVPRNANFNPDEPSGASWVHGLKQLNNKQVARYDESYRLRLRALQSVDDMVDNLFQKLEANNQLDNTYVFYSSDNGFHIMQHRMTPGKMTGYEEDVNVPLIVRGPGVQKNVTSDDVTAHVDLTPTFVHLAGLDQRESFDGQPIPLPYEESAKGNETQVKKTEHANIEFWSTWINEPMLNKVNNTYKSVRLMGQGYNLYYSVWCSNEHELYDMDTDPKQMNNLFRTGFTAKAKQEDVSTTSLGVTDYQLATRLDSLLLVLKSCKGVTCRQPWEALMPGKNVTSLSDALNSDHHSFFDEDVTRINFDRCLNGYIVSAEGPQFDAAASSSGFTTEDLYMGHIEVDQTEMWQMEEPLWSLWN